MELASPLGLAGAFSFLEVDVTRQELWAAYRTAHPEAGEGLEFSRSMPVVCEEFEVVSPV